MCVMPHAEKLWRALQLHVGALQSQTYMPTTVSTEEPVKAATEWEFQRHAFWMQELTVFVTEYVRSQSETWQHAGLFLGARCSAL